jgi:hypothetical protein
MTENKSYNNNNNNIHGPIDISWWNSTPIHNHKHKDVQITYSSASGGGFRDEALDPSPPPSQLYSPPQTPYSNNIIITQTTISSSSSPDNAENIENNTNSLIIESPSEIPEIIIEQQQQQQLQLQINNNHHYFITNHFDEKTQAKILERRNGTRQVRHAVLELQAKYQPKGALNYLLLSQDNTTTTTASYESSSNNTDHSIIVGNEYENISQIIIPSIYNHTDNKEETHHIDIPSISSLEEEVGHDDDLYGISNVSGSSSSSSFESTTLQQQQHPKLLQQQTVEIQIPNEITMDLNNNQQKDSSQILQIYNNNSTSLINISSSTAHLQEDETACRLCPIC